MVRFVAIAVLAVLVYYILRACVVSFLAALRGPAGSAGRSRMLRDELVKDPVCETYIPRRKAIARGAGATTRYFCSAACADKFARRA